MLTAMPTLLSPGFLPGLFIYAFAFTYIMLAAINLITKVKVDEADEDLGLDTSLHGENAYDSGAM